jgi:hypothetical protein
MISRSTTSSTWEVRKTVKCAADEVSERQRGLRHRVHAFERRVEEEKLGSVDQGGRQRQLLAHAEGVVGDQLPPIRGELHGREQLVRAAGGLFASEPVQATYEHEVLPAGEAVEEQEPVRDHADAAFHLVGGRKAQHAQGPRRGREHARQHGDGGALARAVRAEKPVEAPARDEPVEPV